MASRPDGAGVCGRFHRAVELIGARWSGAIIHVLMRGTVRYAELRATIPEISDRMLCERLRELEEAGIVGREVSTEPPVRVDYYLTEKGTALAPALAAIGVWAERWVDTGTATDERKASSVRHAKTTPTRRRQAAERPSRDRGTGRGRTPRSRSTE